MSAAASTVALIRILFSPNGARDEIRRLLLQDLLDARDRLVDRLLGADAFGGDAMNGPAPDVLLPDPTRPPFIVQQLHVHEVWPRHDLDCCAHAVRVVRVEPERLVDE